MHVIIVFLKTNKNNKYIIDIFSDYQKQKENEKEKNSLIILFKIFDGLFPEL